MDWKALFNDVRMKDKEVILIVGEDDSYLATLKESVLQFGYDCYAANSSTDGIQKAFECSPDLIIYHACPNCFKSFAFFNIVKESWLTFDIPFVVISEDVDLENIQFALEMGVDGVFDKPLRLCDLQRIIDVRVKKYVRMKRESERIFLKSFDQVSFPIVIYDTDFYIVNANNSFRNIFNIDGKCFVWDVVGVDRSILQRLSYKIFAGNESREELSLRVKRCGSYEEYNLVFSSLNTLFAKRSALIVFQKTNASGLLGNIDIPNLIDMSNDPELKNAVLDRGSLLLGQKYTSDGICYRGGVGGANELIFTKRQLEVLELSILGLPMKQIADKLCISEKTVEKYRASLMEKTGSKNIIELVLFAIKNKFVQV